MKARGFTLIELLVALAIVGMLLLAAVPLYAQWVADNQINNGAELIAQGLRLAQAEAIKRNAQVQFVIDPTVQTGGWVVQEPAGAAIQKGDFTSGSDRVTFTVSPNGTNTVTFTSLGMVATTNADGSNPLDTIDITSSLSGTRALRVTVGGGRTGIKVCDPAWNSIDATDPKACPTA